MLNLVLLDPRLLGGWPLQLDRRPHVLFRWRLLQIHVHFVLGSRNLVYLSRDLVEFVALDAPSAVLAPDVFEQPLVGAYDVFV